MAGQQRLRDPIHGLIVFANDVEIDELAWRLLQTREMQRLRRVKQLGVSEYVFPSATHTRFAHSIGVFHNARRLMEVVRRSGNIDRDRERVTLIAALLHDVGHGPFSHTFEGAREELARERGQKKIEKHEKFSAHIIRNPNGQIQPILAEIDGSLADEVARLIESEDPIDIHHAVVSSSFDADRLDYLVRDRYMTGTGAGSIDSDWLIDNLTTFEINAEQDDDETGTPIPTFVFKEKGRQAAEDFLLARYRLYSQVYLHKTTRGFEKLLSALLQQIGAEGADPERLGLDPKSQLWQFFQPNGETLEGYLRLDDMAIWGAIAQLEHCNDAHARKLAGRLMNRQRLAVLDVSAEFGHDLETEMNAVKRVDDFAKGKLGKSIFKDEPPYNLYSRAGGETTKAHKMVRVLTGGGGPKEITDFSDTIISKKLVSKTRLTRYYFLNESDRNDAVKAARGR
ncbi:hypothetical protein NS226_06775 [Aureimonas ureilytica]|uniref:HD domain-containing protein n=1 Tax=Aureimonas ureilytica TaxID=401562 RepID=A0A175RCR2_9HYPH|nr:HD domain-containing protein [Aureimonas ureilytica]KTQ96810.1 hypothetical protein NS226_06775 [Aureimonas ureilytica]